MAAADRAASAAERTLITLLHAARIDDWAWHHDATTFRRDRSRQNAVVLAGWSVLRFTWHDLTQRPDRVVGEIRSVTQR